MAGILKEIWVNQLMENFYPDSSFLRSATDMSNFVDNDKINLAEAGVDPDVLVNNSTYPIGVVERSDSPIAIDLDLYETVNTVVRRPESVQLAYDKLNSVIMGHRRTLRKNTAEKAAHSYAPQVDSSTSPVIATTGADNGDGQKQLTVKDILTLKRRFDNLDYPMDKRCLVLNPRHLEDLILFDLEAFKDITDIVNGQPRKFAGFKIYSTSITPKYNKSTLEKEAYGAAPSANTTFCSFAFYGAEVMKADGSVHMYDTPNDPKERGTIVGFDKRFIAVPFRNQGIGAIVSVDI